MKSQLLLRNPPLGRIDESLEELRDLKLVSQCAGVCTACPLWEHSTQVVFGKGPKNAKVMVVGEQPGEHEDQTGEPFVGPSGKVLDACMAEAGLNRAETYVTNLVKHFKWVADGPVRKHLKPDRREIAACRPWLDAELRIVDPEIIVCLGATVTQSLLGLKERPADERGQFRKMPGGSILFTTIHPSAVLRMPGTEAREAARKALVEDLMLVASRLGTRSASS